MTEAILWITLIFLLGFSLIATAAIGNIYLRLQRLEDQMHDRNFYEDDNL